MFVIFPRMDHEEIASMILGQLSSSPFWLGKHTIFWEPLASVLRWLGGIPVDRASPEGIATQVIVTCLRERDRFFLALAPEGTRKKVARWKSGFYRIATGAGVPVVPVALDYRRKVADIGAPLLPTGDYEADLAILRKHFSADMARHPERYQPGVGVASDPFVGFCGILGDCVAGWTGRRDFIVLMARPLIALLTLFMLLVARP